MALGYLLVLLLQPAAAERDGGSSDAAAHLAQGSLQRVEISRKVAKHTKSHNASASQISGVSHVHSVDTRAPPEERAAALRAAVQSRIERFEDGLEARGVSDLGRSQSGLVSFGLSHDHDHEILPSERIESRRPAMVLSAHDRARREEERRARGQSGYGGHDLPSSGHGHRIVLSQHDQARLEEVRRARGHSGYGGFDELSSIDSGSQDVGTYPAIHEFIDIISHKVGEFRDHIERLDQKAAEAEESSKTFGVAVNTMEGGMYNLQMKQIPKFREVVACNQSNKLRGAIPLLNQGAENGKRFSENIASGDFAEVADVDLEDESAAVIGDPAAAPTKVLPNVENAGGFEVGDPIYIMNPDGAGEPNVVTNDGKNGRDFDFTLLWQTEIDHPAESRIIKLSQDDPRLEPHREAIEQFQRDLAQASDLMEGSRVHEDKQEAEAVLTKAVGDTRRDLSSRGF